jgi:Ca2+-binding RTX toxin-like protein
MYRSLLPVAASSAFLLVTTLLPTVSSAAPITCHGRQATLVGTDGADQLIGTPGRDVIAAGPGDDVVAGRGGRDLVCGGPGSDRVWGGGKPDRLLGEDGDDVLHDAGLSGDDRLVGGPGDDVVRATRRSGVGFTSRVLRGGPGADRLVSTVASQRDVLRGGPGTDMLVSSGLVFDETVGSNPDELSGGPGADLLIGQHGGLTDFFMLGDGDVVKVRRAGDDSVPTAPRLNYRRAPGPVLVDLEAGFGKVIGSAVQDSVVGLANAGQDVVLGTKGSDQLFGRDVPPPGDDWAGQDFLVGRGGNDLIHGRAGDDVLSGQNGADVLEGGADNDAGYGGNGTDTCTSIESPDSCEIEN